jgi:putative spermidine/putrescine transport system permease protein
MKNQNNSSSKISGKLLNQNHSLWRWIGLLPFFLFISFFLILPSINLFTGAFMDADGNLTLENIYFLQNTFVLKSYLISIQVSLITSLIGGVLGFFVAYAITLHSTPPWLRNLITTFSGLAANFGGVPLAFAFIATLGRTGFITVLFNNVCYTTADGIKTCPFAFYNHGFNLYSLTGLVLTYTYFQFPLMILTIMPALDGLKKEWREASANLGASNIQYWRDVALPVLWPSILGATILLFGNAFGAYATAQALTGGSIYLVTILIGQQIRGDVLGNPNEGYALALGMVIIMGITILAYSFLQRKTTRWIQSWDQKRQSFFIVLGYHFSVIFLYSHVRHLHFFTAHEERGNQFPCVSGCPFRSKIFREFSLFNNNGDCYGCNQCSVICTNCLLGVFEITPGAPAG